jgi:hypothetical protein
MTKKHFIAMANLFGAYLNGLERAKELQPQATEKHRDMEIAYWNAINAFATVAADFNSNFDANYFNEYVTDIQFGRRDFNGKLIKTRKVA